MEFLFRWAGVLFLVGASWHLDEVPKAQREHGDCPIHDVTLGVLSVKHVLAELSNDTRLVRKVASRSRNRRWVCLYPGCVSK